MKHLHVSKELLEAAYRDYRNRLGMDELPERCAFEEALRGALRAYVEREVEKLRVRAGYWDARGADVRAGLLRDVANELGVELTVCLRSWRSSHF